MPFPSDLIPMAGVGYFGKRLRHRWNPSSRALTVGATVPLARSPPEPRVRQPPVLPLAVQGDRAPKATGAAANTAAWITGAGVRLAWRPVEPRTRMPPEPLLALPRSHGPPALGRFRFGLRTAPRARVQSRCSAHLAQVLGAVLN